MPRFAVSRAAMLALAASCLLAAGAASAQQAKSERCTGGLCDLYYSMQGPETAAAQPTAGGQVTAPRSGLIGTLMSGADQSSGTPAPAVGAARSGGQASTDSIVQGRGGGIVGALTGNATEGCSGILCDLYYQGKSHPPADTPAQETAAAAAPPVEPSASAETTTASADAADAQPSEPLIKYAPPRKCVPTARDPWACDR